MRYVYVVEYANLGKMESLTWEQACKDMKYLIDHGYRNVTVRKRSR